MVVKLFYCFIYLLLWCIPFSCHYIGSFTGPGVFLDASASLSKSISSTSALPVVDGVTCGSGTHGASDTRDVSGTHGASDICDVSGTRGASGTHGTSDICDISGTCGTSGMGPVVPISSLVSALTFSFLPRNGVIGNLLITLATCTFVICGTITQSHSYSLPIV